jgi:hypothetical protein
LFNEVLLIDRRQSGVGQERSAGEKRKKPAGAGRKSGFGRYGNPGTPRSRSETGLQGKAFNKRMKRKIINFDRDDLGDWRAELDCGHYQHVRHKPPLISRLWVLTAEGRREKIGVELECKKCDPGYFSPGDPD